MTDFFVRNIRLQCLIAYDDAICVDAELTIVCYVGNAIRPWRAYPSLAMLAR